MATAPDSSIDELNRQSARIEAEARKLMAEAAKLNAEEYKLSAERHKLESEQYKLDAEKFKLERDRSLSPWLLLAQGLIAGAAIMGAGVALARFLIG